MKSKIFLPLVILLLSSFALQAQDKKISFGVLGGINFQNLNGKDASGDKLENKLILGLHGGVNAMINIGPDFYFQPGLLYSTKGGKSEYDILSDSKADGLTIKAVSRIAYIEMPLNLLYRAQLGNGNVLLGFGPYVALGAGGKIKVDSPLGSSENSIKFKNKVTSSDPSNIYYYRPLDAGANIFFGYEMPFNIFIQLNAQLGLLKINPEYEGDEDSETIIKNTGFGLSVGYRF
jgi:Outer membrane protein beta-barrel domain